MDCVTRRLFNIASGVSLLLWLGTIALWLKSLWRGEWVQWEAPPTRVDPWTLRRTTYSAYSGVAGVLIGKSLDDFSTDRGRDPPQRLDIYEEIARKRPRPLKMGHRVDPRFAGEVFQ
jgi:hypothetical protein